MSADERLARELQSQFDAEERRRRVEETASERLAQRLAASSHSMSDSDESDSADDQRRISSENGELGDSSQLSEELIAMPASLGEVRQDRFERHSPARYAGERGGSARDGSLPVGAARGAGERAERPAATRKRTGSPPASGGGPSRLCVPHSDDRTVAGGKRRRLPPSLCGAGPPSTSPASSSVTGSPTNGASPAAASRTAPDTTRTGPAPRGMTGEPGSDMPADSGRPAPRGECQYGARCYRQGNPAHTAAFSHPGQPAQQPRPAGEAARSSSGAEKGSARQQKRPHGRTTVADRLREAEPVSFFLSKVRSVKSTYRERLALGFVELLDPSLGELRSSLQINFLVDLEWLLEAYSVYGHQEKPLTVLHGIDIEGAPAGNLTVHKVKMPFLFGTHHTKMMLLEYTEGLRVVVHTGNLYDEDWRDKTQGLWVSPLLPPLSAAASSGDGESQTGFRADLASYLASYQLPCLASWLEKVRTHDFSAVRVFFVGSVPGRYQGSAMSLWGHLRVRHLLQTHAVRRSWDLVIQCSSIGRLGQVPEDWLLGELRPSLTGGPSSARTAVIYPTEENVRTSVEGYGGGSCLPYQHQTHQHQLWLHDHLHQWRSDSRNRSGAMPHIKTYCQLSENHERLGWFLLTSANLSKAAWGVLQKQRQQLFVRSYEAGVMFIPKMLDCDSLAVLSGDTAVPRCVSLPYSVPLVPYGDGDKPWFSDTGHRRPDINGATVAGPREKA